MPDSRPQPHQDQDLRSLNAELLQRFRSSGDHRLRNRLVELNLPLVRRVAVRQSASTAVPLDDLVQLGCLGLIRAIEAFDPSRSTALSSFAVPYIRGAMQHHLRDHGHPLRCSRQLRELHRRGQDLQQQRQHLQLPALGEAELAAALGCSSQRWREALELHQALRLRSLDAPTAEGEERGGTLLDRLPARERTESRRAEHEGEDESLCCEGENQRWMNRRLDRLDPCQRQLLLERVLHGASWRRLGADQGLPARVIQRRFDALVLLLRAEIQELVRTRQAPPVWPVLRAPAAGPGPSPAGRRSRSAGRSPVHC
ncbi:sigma-70 family RNA polymerase sigma factor [Synechococcus sp. Cruz-9H2]|uniref:sigma-70 family RNA polymerase sigma factor n=1 Tax=unclassified Synechococcus TaxID=2626047 RepID=UPI0020CB8B93|nr:MULTISPECIES: sigma-70 family RNA polymerase sigma factor [unclassified Synechococcus]MCP9818618.1 sigma-70 family RNA polymerase sigma factor [Synechococcus sp. Cruz-9H2]MCP9842848.1 sigma-70 family RNA polymerase sigma factor [Synechococcus sp. Edmonson 11F2]MCP9855514.1 sigma-70 family RNA polymerase sigma factor [Synechococcus sp. Cruz-9C9]MCP9862240.1 sigma-70 family RNA polymerase sigma factor [Synechococcus sp. Cruz-7E5]MCP9869511.1 sigma-70 family RNA polymerase sigma factor [Synech